MTTAPTPPLHAAFYRFTPLPDTTAAAQALRTAAQHLLGSIVVAHEGINGTVAGAPSAVFAFEATLQQSTFLDGALLGITFKHSACLTPPFGRLKVSIKPEIVALGLPAHASTPAQGPSGETLSPQAWREMLAQGQAVVLDNRNHFEYRLGHFAGAQDPQVHNFRDFVAYVEAQAPAWRAAGRPVAMYCTGGIRCEKTAPWLHSLGLTVLQLEGGILNYFQALPDAHREWQGECYVFDKRMALDCQLQPTATTAAQVFDAAVPDEAWRLQRAERLEAAAEPGGSTPEPTGI
jgi:UPF0176 protein